MRTRVSLWSLIAIGLFWIPAWAQDSVIEGVVIAAGTGAPIAGAQVILLDNTPNKGGVGQATDGQGRFAFTNLTSGAYRFRIAANGYVARDGVTIELAAGRKLSDIAVRLTPAGSISGRLRDADQRPLPGVSVRLMRVAYDDSGRLLLRNVAATNTNDRGEYRIFWVSPGRYYLQAGSYYGMDPLLASMDSPIGGPGTVNPNAVMPDTVVTYFPGSKDLAGARAIEMAAGGDVTGVDWILPQSAPKTKTYRVRVRLTEAQTGERPDSANVLLTAPQSGNATLVRYTRSTGIAEFRNVPPGAYVISAAAMMEPNDTPEGNNAMPALLAGKAIVAVSDSDLDNVVLTLAPTPSIVGRLRVEGDIPLITQWWTAQLEPIRDPQGQRSFFFSNDLSGEHLGNGNFRIDNVPPGEYRVTGDDLSGNAYIKDARLDGVDVLNAPLVWQGAAPGVLEVVISDRGGQIRGTLVDKRAAPVRETQVVLVPDRNRGRVELYKTADTDANGRFTMNGIAPGAYKLFAWEDGEPNGWFDPVLLERSEPHGAPVNVSESATLDVEVRIIAGENTP